MTMSTLHAPAAHAPTRRDRAVSPTATPASLQLRLWRPTNSAVVVRVAGDLDAHNAPHLRELLAPRLTSMADTVVLDLSELEFMGVAGLELLDRAQRQATSRAMTLCLVDGPVCVDRALRAAGWNGAVTTYPTLDAAVADLAGQAREIAPT